MQTNANCRAAATTCPVTFVKSVHGHFTQIWASVNTDGRGQRKVACHLLCFWKCSTSKNKHHPAKSDLRSPIISIAFSSPCNREGTGNKWRPSVFQCPCLRGICCVSIGRYSWTGFELLQRLKGALRQPAQTAALPSALVRSQLCWSHLAL